MVSRETPGWNHENWINLGMKLSHVGTLLSFVTVMILSEKISLSMSAFHVKPGATANELADSQRVDA